MAEALTREFPITYLYEAVLEPQTNPILLLHAHDALELGYCHSGSGVLVVEGRVVPFSAGDICVVTEEAMHMSRGAIGQPSRWSFFWLDAGRLLAGMPDALDTMGPSLFGGPEFPYILSSRKHEKLCSLVRDIVEELRTGGEDHRVVVKGLACAAMAMLHRACRGLQPSDQTGARHGVDRIAPALHRIASHYTDPLDVEQLAALCNTSVRSFRRLFHEAVGKPPLQYLAELRSRMAAAILAESEKSISQVAYEVGFESINTFNRQFRATLGASPREWRQLHRR